MSAIGINNGRSKLHNWMKDPELGEAKTDKDLARDAVAKLKELDDSWEQWYDRAITDEMTPYPEIRRIVEKRIEYLLLSPDGRAKVATCTACTVAPALRVCGFCDFNIGLSVSLAYMEQPDPLAYVDDWASDNVGSDEFVGADDVGYGENGRPM